jgi:hypothetical protein
MGGIQVQRETAYVPKKMDGVYLNPDQFVQGHA